MGTLRKQMTEAMKLRRFSPRTQQSYLAAVTALAKHYRTPPDQLDFEKIKSYLLYLTVERGLSWARDWGLRPQVFDNYDSVQV